MTKATLYEKLRNKEVKCLACNHSCLIPEGKTGICGVRKNLRGELDLMVYNKPIAVNIDPIEKKPLFHFYPGQGAFSLGTIGCNFGCEFCQNWDISQLSKTPEADISKILEETQEWPAKKIIDYCLSNNLKIIAYTYNEPTIWAEYALETMKLAKKNGIKNVWVSNGFFTDKTLKEISPYLDAVNIDLKSFSEKFYNKICKAKLEPVKNNIKQIYDFGIWEEITTLIIPTLNDSEKELSQIAKFLFSISKDLVWHISAFYPA